MVQSEHPLKTKTLYRPVGAKELELIAQADFRGSRFEVNLSYIEKFPIKTVGAQSLHEEYWIPAEEMQEFNDNIVGKIEVISTFKGDKN